MSSQDIFLEQALLEEERITTVELETARLHALEHKVDLVDALIACDVISARDIALAKAGICEAPYVEIDQYEASFANTRLLPRAAAEQFRMFPLFKIDDVLTLAMDDPLNLEAMDQARL